ncbi:hypothetical protein [uncultured Duncaniella sp.]|nr:hypothetical protein [uncultured Duncaniella sp.]
MEQYNRKTLEAHGLSQPSLRGIRASATLSARKKAGTSLKRLKAYDKD